MLKKIAIGIVAVVVIILGLALLQPNSFAVSRSIAIKAPAEKIYPLISDFHEWGKWSPWEGLDPNMKRTFTGPASGAGAVYSWDGNDAVGAGRMEITGAQAPSKVDIKLDFLKPIASQNTTVFALQPEGDGTKVVWTMSGPSSFMTKLMGVFVSMDKMIGPDFEKGLASMKAAAEK
ncbi:K(+)-transporting ATPase subunit F [Pseudoduganella ginsengisoli]|uniref:Polyketide cyclase n=1 Tax=Pseudoduganella ginsengisoli TaxID=1462440 RepID=A0A6L6PXW7_9BURK|nr:SRPBCC family protein [Pseudoduganella ginsengisoli]MTW02305.1 polyketide cyclase [Pseudoduganella ginsengisoli]